MSRLHKISMVVFCIGVLLCGIGVGVMFVEFDGFVYGGEYALGEPDMRTEHIDVAFEPGDEALAVLGVAGSYNCRPLKIETDSRIPKDTVRFQVTYNAKRAEPFAHWAKDEGYIDFGWYWKDTVDDLALVMEAKDVILRNLKEGRLVSCDVPHVEEVEVVVHPANEEDVRIGY